MNRISNRRMFWKLNGIVHRLPTKAKKLIRARRHERIAKAIYMGLTDFMSKPAKVWAYGNDVKECEVK